MDVVPTFFFKVLNDVILNFFNFISVNKVEIWQFRNAGLKKVQG